MEIGTKIGEGERSKVYNHPNNNNLVIKVTNDKTEKEVADFFFNNPSELFVNIVEIEKVGRKYFIVAEKVENPDFKFKCIDGSFFLENKYNGRTFQNMFCSKDEYISNIENKVVPEQKYLVKQYYEFLEKAIKLGMDLFDTAWNLGFKNGQFICFDTTI